MPSHPAAEVDASVADAIQRAAEFAARQGARVSDRARPDFDPVEAYRVYVTLLRAATSGRMTAAQFAQAQAIARERPDDDGYEAQAARAGTIVHKDWLAASNRRHQMRRAWAEFFRDWDVLLCPTAATPAFEHNHLGERWERMLDVNGRPQPGTTQMFWAGYSGAFFLPATVAPVALAGGRLPVGVQIVGPQYGDYRTIGVAQLLEREYYAFVPPPGFEQPEPPARRARPAVSSGSAAHKPSHSRSSARSRTR
jgi:amidase